MRIPLMEVLTYLSPIPLTVMKPPFVDNSVTREIAATTFASPCLFIVSDETKSSVTAEFFLYFQHNILCYGQLLRKQ